MNKRSNIAPIAIFFACMIVIHLLSSILFNVLPFPIKPTIVHIPVIIASIIYGPRIGATLGFLMGLISLTVNTITILLTFCTKWKPIFSHRRYCTTYLNRFDTLFYL